MLWLLRHADAADGPPDDERPLTERGVMQAQDAGHAMAALGVTVDTCLSSPKLRAMQTAQLVCASLGDTLLVGHDPSFTLTLHDLTGAQARMRKGGLAGIVKGELVVLMRPSELSAIAGRERVA
jgi:phosphohistidine phosphatase